MAQQDIKQIRGASQGSILFLGTNSVVSEDFNNFSWNQSTSLLSINGNLKFVDGNQSAGRVLTGDASGNATWQNARISAAGGETGRTYYMAPSINSDIATYFEASTSPSPGSVVSIVTNNTGTASNFIGAFATTVGEPSVDSLPAGIALRVVHGHVQNNPEIARYRLDLYKRSAGGTETLLRTGYSDPFGNLIKDEISFTFVAPTPFALLDTDRIVFKLYTERVSGPSTVTVTTYFEGDDASYIKTTIVSVINLTSTYIPQANPSGTTLIDGTWKYDGLNIVPVTASSNIGNATNYVDTIFLGSTLNYASNLIFSEGGTESARFDGGNLGIGTASPSTNLVVQGGFRYVDGNQTSGYVLTSDANGLATWALGSTASVNFSNTDLIFTGNRLHDTDNNILTISTDGTGYLDAYLYLEPGTASNEAVQLYKNKNGLTVLNTGTQLDFNYIPGIEVKSGLVEVNGQKSYDFRVKGLNDDDTLYVDESVDSVGIGTNLPLYKLQVIGTVSTTGFRMTDGASSGYILQSDSNGVGSWTAASLGGGVTGSGTTNYVPRWTSIDTLSSTGSIYDDGSFVGINQTTPLNRLHIEDTSTQARFAYDGEHYTLVSHVWSGSVDTFAMQQWGTDPDPIFLMSGGGGGKTSLKLSLRPNVNGDSWNILNEDIGGKKSLTIKYGALDDAYFRLESNAVTKLGINGLIGANVGVGITFSENVLARFDVYDDDTNNSGTSVRVRNGDLATILDLRADGEFSLASYTFPNSDGLINQVLQTNGSGQLLFGTPSSSTNLQGNGLTANGSALDVNVNSDSLEITSDLIRLKDNISGNRTFSGDLAISGDLTVSGTTSYINTENLYVEDNIITLNATYSGPAIVDAGIEVNHGDGTYSTLLWDASEGYWRSGLSGSVSTIITEAGTGLTKTNNELSVDFTSLPFTTSWSSGFNNGNVGSLTYLRRQDGTPTNISPYVAPVNMTIVMVAASSDVAQNWTMTIRKTDSVGLTYSTIHTITATASRQQINTGLSIDIDAGDRIATRLEVGSSIDYPNIDIYVKSR